jgi:hypothetical protein
MEKVHVNVYNKYSILNSIAFTTTNKSNQHICYKQRNLSIMTPHRPIIIKNYSTSDIFSAATSSTRVVQQQEFIARLQ